MTRCLLLSSEREPAPVSCRTFAVVIIRWRQQSPHLASVNHGAIDRRGARGVGQGRNRRSGPIIETVWPEAYRVALSILRDHGLAEDAAQDACATIARSLGALKNDNMFATWTYRIAANAAGGIERTSCFPTQSLDPVVARGGSFDTAEAVDLDNALAELPVVQRAVILLHYYAGLKSPEIAAATGLPSSTIRFHIMLARRALRKALAVEEAVNSPSARRYLRMLAESRIAPVLESMLSLSIRRPPRRVQSWIVPKRRCWPSLVVSAPTRASRSSPLRQLHWSLRVSPKRRSR